MVTVTIDGKKLDVPDGTTVLRAAESAGITIPTLCDHKSLTPYGGCRLCLVEVEGMRTLQPSCTLPVSTNMVVKTDTDKVKEARKFVLTLIFSERNHFCMYCQVSGGDCELQNAAYNEGMTHWPLQPNWQPFAVDASHPYFVLDNNRCILCRRCVRACAESVGNYTLGIEERGANSYLVADLGTPLGESTCISCGNCIQVCPTGSLIDRQSAYLGRDKESIRTKSVCTQCSIGCGIEVVSRDTQISRIEGDWDAAVNNGLLCAAGRFEPISDKRDRVATSLVRGDNGLKAATYAEALEAAAKALKGDGVVALTSTKLTAEALFEFKKLFGDGLKNVKFGSLDEGAYTSFIGELAAANKKPFEATINELDSAGCVVILGADVAKEHQVAGFLVKRSLPQGTKLVVVDDGDNGMKAFADEIINPVGKMANAIEQLKSSKLIANSSKVVFLLGKGMAAAGAEAAKNLMTVVADLRKAGKEVSFTSLKGEANSYAAYLFKLDHAVDLKGAKAAFILLGEEDPSQKLIKDLEKVPFVFVQAAYSSPLTAKANVVIPAPIWAEIQGHYINMEGKVQSSTKIVEMPEAVVDTSKLLADCAKAVGVKVDGDWAKGLDKTLLVTELIGA